VRYLYAKAIATFSALVALAAFAPAGAPATLSDSSTRLPCVVFDTNLGEYGAWVFALRHKPNSCTEYRGNKPCHCTESLLTKIRWRQWGSRRAAAKATWHYCGMGTCIYLRAQLLASRKKSTCGDPVYTRLRLKIPRQRDHGHLFGPINELFKLPACGGPFQYI
jgi:hypothetical protein